MGVPEEASKSGECVDCKYYAPIDGNGHLLDYGVCSSNLSAYDGRVVNFRSGCQKYAE